MVSNMNKINNEGLASNQEGLGIPKKAELSNSKLELPVITITLEDVIETVKKQSRMKIIEFIYHSKKAATFEEIKKNTGLETNSLYHHLNELQKRNIIESNENSKKFNLTTFAIKLFNLNEAEFDDKYDTIVELIKLS